MHISRTNRIIRKFAGFSVVGVIVTLLSMVISYVLLKILATPLLLTYILVYGATIFISFKLNSKLIFKTGSNARNLVIYFLVYGVGMVVGTVMLWILRIVLPFENWILPYLVIPFTMASNFTLSYYFLKPEKSC
ncbi:MAG: GtrA family protein [Bacteroidetes bacterium]|nr:GtrA family protein [Bacteroidota bacterium]